MKYIVSIFAFALIYAVSSLPINDQLTGANGSVATVPSEAKAELKPETQSTPLAAEEKLSENAGVKESSSQVPSSTLSSDAIAPVKEELTLDSSKQGLPSSSIVNDNQSNKVVEPGSNNAVSSEDAVKSEAAIKPETLSSEVSEKSENKIEQASVSSEQPKESNNQVNAVSVDEPKPVQNEVKSEIPKEVKAVQVKEAVKSEKLEESKEDKAGESSAEARPPTEQISPEELKKPILSSSEEKAESAERDISKANENKETITAAKSEQKKEGDAIKKEDINLEKISESPKKEESSIKPVLESQPTEPSKQSPLAPSPTLTASSLPSEKPADKSESEKDVIKREAAKKDKYDEKKPTDIKGDKLTKTEPIKTSDRPPKVQ